ncbi:MAG: amino acid adenylation domain-containing protein, partial [Methyloversatilis sp.]|nr:amino acid adenylation domain-containing protein [Methyloversatilis sp.]
MSEPGSRHASLSAGQLDALRSHRQTQGARRSTISVHSQRHWTELHDGQQETRQSCSFAQSRLWFLEQWEPGTSLYHVVQSLQVAGRVDAAALQGALDALVLRHESLRTGFADEGGEPVQRIVSSARCVLSVEDLRGVEAARRADELESRRQAHGAQPFDLAQPPLLRAALWQLGEEEQVLQLVIHHIGSDGWSQGVLNRELSALYAAALDGRPAQLPELPLQYADYALWQRETLSGPALQTQLDYWRNQLADLSVLALPTDHARPAQPSYRGAVLRFEVDARLTSGLRALAREAGGTLYMVLLAAFKVLLARTSGQNDIAVGTPVAGRGQVELEGLIGFFVNTLVLRTQVPGESGFRDVLQRVKETALGAYDHAQMPFEKLVEALAPQRDPSRNPLFQVMFALQNAPTAALALQGTQCRRLPQQGGIAKFDLTLEIAESGDALSCVFEYATDLFDEATVECMAQDYRALLEAIVAESDRAVGHLPALTPAKHRQVPAGWNATAVDYPRDATLASLFEAQVARMADAVALVCDDTTLTYAELNAQANRVAHVLRGLEVGRDSMVGLYLERSVELVAGMLGILKAGGAWVPLDPTYPAARLAFMLNDTAAHVVLTQSSLMPALRGHAGRVICLDGEGSDADAHLLAAAPVVNPLPAAQPDDLAYVIYTSGSTGRPKGVMISHAAICNHMHWMLDTFGFSESDRIFQKTGICADASVWEFFAPLLSGGRMVLAAEGSQRDPAHLVRQIKAFGVTVMQVVPSLLKALLAEPGFAECRSLRQVFCGGEALDAAVAQAFFGQCSARLHNLYGPTEAAIDATWWTCDPDDRRPIPIGRPIANMQAHVLDAAQQPVPVGVAGELYLDGAGLARGYLGRPDLTAEKFVAHPFSDVPGARLYRTGDRVRWREDGCIEFLNRVDHQIKLRGFRIEPGEIEAALLGLPGIRDAVAAMREDRPGDARLVAYVVTEDGNPDGIDLRAQLERILPAHMVPSAIVALKALPLTAHGKLDRAALPAPASGAAPDDCVAPRTPAEQTLASIWCDILGLPDVGIRQNFFDLGGHSLLAVQLVNRLRRTFSCDVPLRIVFDSPTIERMAAACRSLLEGIAAVHEPDMNDAPVLTPSERHRVPVEWNATRVDYPRDATLASMFEMQAARTPDALALVCGDATLCYAALDARANRIAHALRALGVGPDSMVGLHLERSLDLVAGMLGILKAGGACVPLDPAYPAARLAFMLDDIKAAVVLTQASLQPTLPAYGGRTLCVDDDAALALQPSCTPSPRAAADNLAYVIYTSGSTGRPKGVMVSHAAVCNRMHWLIDTFGIGPADAMLVQASINFDVSVGQLLACLFTGGRSVLALEHERADSAALVELTRAHEVSIWDLTPSMLRPMLDEPGVAACSALRHVFCGGEVLEPALARVFRERMRVPLHNIYGPTEAAIDATCWTCDDSAPGPIPIGRPIANTEVFVLDGERQPVSVGVEGELYIGGAGLARGYLGRPELTQEKFVAHPFSEA